MAYRWAPAWVGIKFVEGFGEAMYTGAEYMLVLEVGVDFGQVLSCDSSQHCAAGSTLSQR